MGYPQATHMPEEQNQGSVLAAILSLSQQVASIDKNLAVNTSKTEGVEFQLTKLNGKVATHEAALGTLQQAIALFTQATDQKDKTESDWKGHLIDKMIWLGLGFLAVVIYTILIRTHTIVPLSTLGNPQTYTNESAAK